MRKMKNDSKNSGHFAIFLGVLLLGFMIAIMAAPAEAWYGDYSYRQGINVSTVVNATVTQLPLNITYNANMTSNFSDLFFVHLDDATPLNFFVADSQAGAWALVYVNMNITTDNLTQLYMYYGKSGSANYSNGSATFLYFDDFLNLDNWTKAAGTGTASVADGIVTVPEKADYYGATGSAGDPIRAVSKVKVTNTVANGYWITGSRVGTSNMDYGCGFITANGANYIQCYDGAASETAVSFNWTDNAYHVLETSYNDASVKFYANNTYLGAIASHIPATTDRLIMRNHMAGNSGQTLYLDYYATAKYITTMPNFTFSAIETSPLNINITTPTINQTTHNYTVLLNYTVTGAAANYTCNHSTTGYNSSNYQVTNGTAYDTYISLANGNYTIYVNCTDGSGSTSSSVNITQDIGKLIINTYNSLSQPTLYANTTIAIYNSSSYANFTGNNHTFEYGNTSVPHGDITILAKYDNVTLSYSKTLNSTSYENLSITFPSNVGNYYFLCENIYGAPLEDVHLTFYELDGDILSEKYTQPDGYAYEVFLTVDIPIRIVIEKTGFMTKNISFTPYTTTSNPTVFILEAEGSTVYNPVMFFYSTEWTCALVNTSETDNVLKCNATNGAGYLNGVCLYVQQRVNMTANTSICSGCNTSSYSCQLGNITERLFYYYFFGNFTGDIMIQLESGIIDRVTPTEGDFGKYGLFLAALLFITLGFIGIYAPAVSIMLSAISLTFSAALGLIDISFTSILSIIFVAIIASYKARNR